MHEKELWKNTLARLETDLSKATVATFFRGVELGEIEGESVRLLCPNRLTADHLQHRYAAEIRQALSELSGKECALFFEVKTASLPKPQELPLFSAPEHTGLFPSYTFENFIVGLSNRLAVSVGQAVAGRPGQLHNPLFLHSGVGLGKTHLMHAVGNAIREENPQARVLYCPAESFTNELIRAIQNQRSTASFRRKFRSVDVLLVDDVQFLAGKQTTQEEFFNTFNELYLSGRQIILTSDRHPGQIRELEARLVSRFVGGMTADIQEPDLEMRLAILKQKAAEKGARLEEGVLLEIAQKIQGSIRGLEGALNQLLALAENQELTPTPALAQQLMSTAPRPGPAFVEAQTIVRFVAQRLGVAEELLLSPKRSREAVQGRKVTAYLLRRLGQVSFARIGEILGGRDHTTILHALAEFDHELSQNPLLRQQVENLQGEILGK